MPDKVYLDDNGNPKPPAGAGAKVYLDDNGNPIGGGSQQPQSQIGQFQTHPGSPTYNARTGNLPEDSDLPAPDSAKGIARQLIMPLAVGDKLRAGARSLEAQNDISRRAALRAGQPGTNGGLDALRGSAADALRMGSDALSPKGIALTGATVAAPEVVLPLMGAYGASQAAGGAADIAQHGANPQNTREALTGAATLAGSGAGALTPGVGAAGRQKISDFNTLRSNLAQKVVQPLVYEGLGEAGADARMGVNPEAAITNEGLVGTKRGLLGKTQDRTAQLKSAADNILQTHPNASQTIDAAPIIDQEIDRAIAGQQRLAGSTERLENLRTALKSQYGNTSGTPFEMNNLKTEIQQAAQNLGAYRNSQPIESSVADAMGNVARGLKNQVNAAIPEVPGVTPGIADLNERMSNLIDAQGGLQRNIVADKGRSVFGGGLHGATSTLLNRTLGSAPVRSGLARVLNLGLTEDVPPPQAMTPPPIVPSPALLRGPGGPPPSVPPQFRVQAAGTTQNPSVLTQNRSVLGQQGIRGLLPAPPSTVPPPVPPEFASEATGTVQPPALHVTGGQTQPVPMGPRRPPAPQGRPALSGPTSSVPSSVEGTPPPSGISPQPSGTALQSVSASPNPPSQAMPPPAPVNPQEAADLSQQLGRQISPNEVPGILRRLAVERNVNQRLAPPVTVKTDSMGIRWAESPEGYRVSIPRGVPDSDIPVYAQQKLAEQQRIHRGLLAQ